MDKSEIFTTDFSNMILELSFFPIQTTSNPRY
nr:MAG TPA: hypothetical protein [Caudoviricetes sp.]